LPRASDPQRGDALFVPDVAYGMTAFEIGKRSHAGAGEDRDERKQRQHDDHRRTSLAVR
jgi:hypothetical protein